MNYNNVGAETTASRRGGGGGGEGEKKKRKKRETKAEEEGATTRELRTQISLSTKSMAIKWHRLPELFLQLPIFLLHVKRQKAVIGSWYKAPQLQSGKELLLSNLSFKVTNARQTRKK